MTRAFRNFLLAGAALTVLASTAQAATHAAPQPANDPAVQAKIDALSQRVDQLNLQLRDLQQGVADQDSGAALSDLKRSTSAQYTDLSGRIDTLPKVSVDNARLQVISPDGQFSVAVRALVQYDLGYFSQGRNPASVDLNSGGNFRRAQLGLQGTAFGDWSYNFVYDFGGNGVEKPGYIYTAYIQYDGLKPFGFRIGAYAPPEGIEDATGSADLIFLERASSTDIARNIAGSPSRDAVTFFAQGDRYLAAVSYTGGKAADAATFDEQQAVVGRLSYLAVSDGDFKWLLDANYTNVFKLADSAAGNSPTPPSFSNGPELGIDASKTINTGTFNADGITEWGVETAATWSSLYAQAGYFGYSVQRRNSALSDPYFSGWYTQATWSLSGDARRYDPTTASFRNPRPSTPLGRGGFGSWELVARYSDMNLNDNPLLPVAAGGVSGGKQDVWTAGINWYPNDVIHFALQYENIKVSHPNVPTSDLNAEAIALRSQISL